MEKFIVTETQTYVEEYGHKVTDDYPSDIKIDGDKLFFGNREVSIEKGDKHLLTHGVPMFYQVRTKERCRNGFTELVTTMDVSEGKALVFGFDSFPRANFYTTQAAINYIEESIGKPVCVCLEEAFLRR